MVPTKITIITILTIIYCAGIPSDSYGVSSTSPWWTHFTYQFLHGSFIHLLSNAYALWFCLNKKNASFKNLLSIYLMSVLASFIIPSSIPTVGSSGMIFSIIGINLISAPTKRNIIYTTIILITGFIIPHIAGGIHLTCFILGFTVSAIYKNINRFKNDCC
ncbi:rhomboid family intramembrane serine protease [Bacteroides sp.]|uniref:rhomboid family intramembrane serine protease n=1 Tax=Bacteroides sp. TaxID=29523 RepID=UPI00345D9FD2